MMLALNQTIITYKADMVRTSTKTGKGGWGDPYYHQTLSCLGWIHAFLVELQNARIQKHGNHNQHIPHFNRNMCRSSTVPKLWEIIVNVAFVLWEITVNVGFVQSLEGTCLDDILASWRIPLSAGREWRSEFLWRFFNPKTNWCPKINETSNKKMRTSTISLEDGGYSPSCALKNSHSRIGADVSQQL